LDIQGKSVLILGGYGLVGQAVARRLLRESPRRLTLLSLKREEAEEAVRALGPEQGAVEIVPAWGDLFTSRYLRDRQFWSAEGLIQPGKVVGWIFATEDKGARMK
jgi:NAD(P)-dependent dehydrogenase (short-subunit alcohol dehydrogenase family)